jgi:RNA polymerase sigma factor (sigma-70 family)
MENKSQLTDGQLVARYAQGDNKAFDELLRRNKSNLYTYILFVVHNEVIAEDIFQETFVRAIMRIQQGRYVENGKFSGWLVRIAHNLIIDHFRMQKNVNIISNDACEKDLFADPTLVEGNIENEIIQTQSLDDLRKILEYLPVNQREVVYMHYYQNLTFKEIAEITSVSINTALGRMRYALLNMRKMIDKYGIVLTEF